MKNDYLIVGQGLAGSLLGWNLLKEGKSINIIDADFNQSSSIIAAGLVNPLTGKRFTLMPEYPILFEYAKKTYQEFSDKFKENFFIPYDIIRLFKNTAEKNKFEEYRKKAEIQNYIKKDIPPSGFSESIDSTLGGFVIKDGGFCRTSPLLKNLQSYFLKENILIKETFSYPDITVEDNSISWKGHSFKAIIFCEGYQSIHNPWFKYLPFQPVKGEILTLKLDTDKLPKAIIKHSTWLIPYEKNICKAGSSYSWDELDCFPTEENKSLIMEDLKAFLKLPFEVIDHHAGVRPATPDQQPILGEHPKKRNIYILNGFGSKGILTIPFYAHQLCQHIISGKTLDHNVNINRFPKAA